MRAKKTSAEPGSQLARIECHHFHSVNTYAGHTAMDIATQVICSKGINRYEYEGGIRMARGSQAKDAERHDQFHQEAEW